MRGSTVQFLPPGIPVLYVYIHAPSIGLSPCTSETSPQRGPVPNLSLVERLSRPVLHGIAI